MGGYEYLGTGKHPLKYIPTGKRCVRMLRVSSVYSDRRRKQALLPVRYVSVYATQYRKEFRNPSHKTLLMSLRDILRKMLFDLVKKLVHGGNLIRGQNAALRMHRDHAYIVEVLDPFRTYSPIVLVTGIQ